MRQKKVSEILSTYRYYLRYMYTVDSKRVFVGTYKVLSQYLPARAACTSTVSTCTLR